MAYVITEDCAPSNCLACLDVCPVDAIHPKPGAAAFFAVERLSINADTCIHCGSCARVCPFKASIAMEKPRPLWGYFDPTDSASYQSA